MPILQKCICLFFADLYQIRLHRNDKKTAENSEQAEEERLNFNNSDTNGKDIICNQMLLKQKRN